MGLTSSVDSKTIDEAVVCCLCSCGGVEMVVQGGKIKLDNTLDSRLALISHQVSIRVCHNLKGHSTQNWP